MENHTPDSIDYAALGRLGDQIAELSAHLEAATARLLDLIREFDERGGWNTGFRSCAAWLSWRVGLDLGAARERVRVARALGTLPRLAQALARGELSYAKVRALTRVATPETEERLLAVGRAGTADHVERIVRGWRRVDRKAEARDDTRRHASRALHVYQGEDGMVIVRGRLAPEVGAVLVQALTAAREALYQQARGMDAKPSSANISAEPSMWLSPLPVPLKLCMLRTWRVQRSVTLVVRQSPARNLTRGVSRYPIVSTQRARCDHASGNSSPINALLPPERRRHGHRERAVCGPRRAQSDGGGRRAGPRAAARGAPRRDEDLCHHDARAARTDRLADRPWRHRRGDGVHGRVLAASGCRARGPRAGRPSERTAREDGAGPQDGCEGLRVAGAVARMRPAARQFRAAPRGARSAGFDALAQGAHPRAGPPRQSDRENARARADQDRRCRHGPHGQDRPRDSRGAECRPR